MIKKEVIMPVREVLETVKTRDFNTEDNWSYWGNVNERHVLSLIDKYSTKFALYHRETLVCVEDNNELYTINGKHELYAMKFLSEERKDEMFVNIVVLDKVTRFEEILMFIENTDPMYVDMSWAIYNYRDIKRRDLNVACAELLSTMLAHHIVKNDESMLHKNVILTGLDGINRTDCFTVKDFVIAYRNLLFQLIKLGIIDKNTDKENVEKIYSIHKALEKSVYYKWGAKLEYRGNTNCIKTPLTIHTLSIFLYMKLKEEQNIPQNCDELCKLLDSYIKESKATYEIFEVGGEFYHAHMKSKMSSHINSLLYLSL